MSHNGMASVKSHTVTEVQCAASRIEDPRLSIGSHSAAAFTVVFLSHLVYINIMRGNVQPLSLLCLGVQLSVELSVLSMNEWYPLKSSFSSCISLTDDIHSSIVTLKICKRPDQCSRMTGTVVLHMRFEVLLGVYIQLWFSRI
jgi:hypothetical protein